MGRAREATQLSIRRALLAASVATGLALLSVPVAQAGPANAARGEAIAIARASLTGGLAATAHSPDANGAPASFADGVRIDPFVDGAVYCGAGWHVISFGAGDSLARYTGHRSLTDALNAVEFGLTLDGLPLALSRTSAHRYLNPLDFPGDLFAVNAAALLAPG